MKEDVLEQIVDDYLQFLGYFTRHNVRFKPSPEHPDFSGRDDNVPSDVDVVGIHPRLGAVDRVWVVSCKSWQSGFDPAAKLAELRGEKRNGAKATWRMFRELWVPKWSQAFVDQIEQLTGEREFTYCIAVTRLKGGGTAAAWQSDPTISRNLPGCSVAFLPLETIWGAMLGSLGTTPASSEIGRLAQLLRAAGLTAARQVAPPAGPEPGSDAEQVEAIENDAP